MSNEILTMIGLGIALGLFVWRITGRLDTRIDRLDNRIDRLQEQVNELRKDVHNLAREFSELRGELRGSQA